MDGQEDGNYEEENGAVKSILQLLHLHGGRSKCWNKMRLVMKKQRDEES